MNRTKLLAFTYGVVACLCLVIMVATVKHVVRADDTPSGNGNGINYASLINTPQANAATAVISVSSLLSLGTTTAAATSPAAQPGMFYTCGFSTSNTAAQNSLEAYANVVATGQVNIIVRNASAVTLTGGYNISVKCVPI